MIQNMIVFFYNCVGEIKKAAIIVDRTEKQRIVIPEGPGEKLLELVALSQGVTD